MTSGFEQELDHWLTAKWYVFYSVDVGQPPYYRRARFYAARKVTFEVACNKAKSLHDTATRNGITKIIDIHITTKEEVNNDSSSQNKVLR